jgi:hypothetical protein
VDANLDRTRDDRRLAALMLYCQTNSMRGIIHDEVWEEVHEYTIAHALCRFAGRPTPPMSKIVAEERANLVEAAL